MIVLWRRDNAAISAANPADSVPRFRHHAAELAGRWYSAARTHVLFFLGMLLFAFTSRHNLLGEFPRRSDGVWEVWRETVGEWATSLVAGHRLAAALVLLIVVRDPGDVVYNGPRHDADLSHSAPRDGMTAGESSRHLPGTVALVVLMTRLFCRPVWAGLISRNTPIPGSRLTRSGARRGQQPGRACPRLCSAFSAWLLCSIRGRCIDRAPVRRPACLRAASPSLGCADHGGFDPASGHCGH